MTGYYNASAAAGGAEPPDHRDLLARLSQRSVDTALDHALDQMDDLLARLDEQDAAEGVPPEVVTALESLTGAEDAPLTYRSLHRRVEEGFTSWEAFWRAPEQEADGMRLVRDVMRVSREGIATDLSDLPPVQ